MPTKHNSLILLYHQNNYYNLHFANSNGLLNNGNKTFTKVSNSQWSQLMTDTWMNGTNNIARLSVNHATKICVCRVLVDILI